MLHSCYYHFTGTKNGDTQISKGPPLQWLAHFLAQYNPLCKGKYVFLDQGGELFNHPEVGDSILQALKSFDIKLAKSEPPEGQQQVDKLPNYP